MKTLRPVTLTRTLTRHGFTRYNGIQGGFRVLPTDRKNRLTVEYALPYTAADQDDTAKRETLLRLMREMERILSERFDVILFEPDTGWSGFYLRVTSRPDDGLSEHMREALRVIRDEPVVYRYGPLTPSVNRPVPVTSKDVTPMFSHGLRASTVLALEKRGRVRLVPVTPEHGAVEVMEVF